MAEGTHEARFSRPAPRARPPPCKRRRPASASAVVRQPIGCARRQRRPVQALNPLRTSHVSDVVAAVHWCPRVAGSTSAPSSTRAARPMARTKPATGPAAATPTRWRVAMPGSSGHPGFPMATGPATGPLVRPLAAAHGRGRGRGRGHGAGQADAPPIGNTWVDAHLGWHDTRRPSGRLPSFDPAQFHGTWIAFRWGAGRQQCGQGAGQRYRWRCRWQCGRVETAVSRPPSGLGERCRPGQLGAARQPEGGQAAADEHQGHGRQ